MGQEPDPAILDPNYLRRQCDALIIQIELAQNQTQKTYFQTQLNALLIQIEYAQQPV